MNTLRDESFYYQYEQNGGTVEMPKEVFWELYNDSKEEIERLNNIINEIEKWLEEDLKQVYRDAGHRHNLILEVLDKLHELKGSDNDEKVDTLLEILDKVEE